MIVLSAGQKGGTGKSTVAANLAVVLQQWNKRLIIVDADAAQPTMSYWANRRERAGQPAITCVAKSGDIAQTLNDLNRSYEVVLCDVIGQAGDELLSGLAVADLLISPIRPSQPDIETLRYLKEAVRAKRQFNDQLHAVVVLSQAPTHHLLTHADDARQAIGSVAELSLAATVIHHRTAYIDAMEAGLGVTELRNASAAAKEITDLAQELWRPATILPLSQTGAC